ncbi:MAG: hypothetical protein ACYCSO_10305 [Cuniculiplasma sp.]
MTEIIKIELDEELARKFRKKAYEQFGYKKGSMKMAIESMIRDYTDEGVANWDNIRGILKGRKESSVELQHNAWSGIRDKSVR